MALSVEKSKSEPKTVANRVEKLRKNRERIQAGGGQERIDKQHAAGKLTARERVDKLVDRESFQEIGLFAQHRSTYFGMADKEMPRRRRGYGLRHRGRPVSTSCQPGFHGCGRGLRAKSTARKSQT